jgi:hypothetical protein
MANEDKHATLLAWLQTALELELSTIPPYMIALLSIREKANREPANLIRGVMIEEMLHMALVSNVLNAVGGAPRLGPDNIPSYPLQMNFEGQSFRDRKFPVDLARFSQRSVGTFMDIERPEGLFPLVAAKFVEIDVPGLTIGEFYNKVIKLLEELDAGGALFIGDPSRQLHDDYYWGGGNRIIPVNDLVSAKEALNIVITQGEGAWHRPGGKGVAFTPGAPLKMGHYFRFAEISYGRHYAESDDPARKPTGAPLPVDYSDDGVYPIKANPKASDYEKTKKLAELNDAFNIRYTEMLRQLEQAFSGTPKTLYTAIMNGMHGLPPLATTMMQTKIDGDPDGNTGCPTFGWTAVAEARDPLPEVNVRAALR